MSEKISIKELDESLQQQISAGGSGTVKSINSEIPDAEGNVALGPADVEAVSIYGGKLGGDYFFEGTTERVLGYKGPSEMKHGFFFNANGIGIYDWANGRNVFNYNSVEDEINITTNIVRINGVPTSLEGHKHDATDITNINKAITDMMNEYGIGGPAKQLPAGYDLNNIRATGVYMGTGLLNANIAADQWAFYIHLEHNERYALQIELPLANADLKDKIAKRHLFATEWQPWAPFGGAAGGSEYVHVGDFKPGNTTWGVSRFHVDAYKKVKFVFKNVSKTVYAADKAGYTLELELYSPLATTNTHFQRILYYGGTNLNNTGNKLQLVAVPATSDNNLPFAIHGEVEIDLLDPFLFTKSRMYLMSNTYTSGSTHEVSGRQLVNEIITEGRRTFNRTEIPVHVTFTFNSSVDTGTISMYGIPR